MRPDALEPSKKQDYFETFSVAHGLKHEGLWNTPMKAENFPFHAPEVKIYKQGIVYRRSVIGLGWEPVLLVLTESGFLHQFEMKKDKQVVKHYKTQEANRDVTSGTLHRGRESCEIDQNILDDTHKPSLR